jgi:hypothetical protein
MTSFHRTRHRNRDRIVNDNAHLNWMGGPSFQIPDPVRRLRIAASSCFFGEPMYYHRDAADTAPERRPQRPERRTRRQPAMRPLTDQELRILRETLGAADSQEWMQAWRKLSPAELMERVIDEALAADAAATLAEAARLRREDHMRTTPQVILVRAAHHPAVRGTGLVRQSAPGIIARADEPAVGLAYQLWRFGKPIPNALKKAWRDALGRFDDYQLAKYRLESRQSKTVDVVNLVHPKAEAVHRLVRGELRATGRTWEAILSEKGSSQATWLEALEVMGHMALLRNLRNLLEHGVAPERFLPRLVAGAATGQQLPFRYYSAYEAIRPVAPVSVLDALEECMTIALGNLPRFRGRVMSLCDNSGSACSTTTSCMGSMRMSTIANLTGVLTGMCAEDGHVGVFGDRLERVPIRARSSIFQQLDYVEQMARDIGGATENGIWLFWDQALRKRERWDTVFVYSDMQAGHGGLYGTNPREYADYLWGQKWGKPGNYIDVPKLIATYRTRVNPGVQVFLVQVAGYQGTIVPEHYQGTHILGGWSDGVLRFAARMIELAA